MPQANRTMDSLEHIKATAAEWVARRHAPHWSNAEEAAFAQWLNASMSNRVEYLCHEKTWREADRLKVLGAGAQAGAVLTINDWRASPYFNHLRPFEAAYAPLLNKPRRAGKYLALAASLLVLCATGYFGWNSLQGVRYSTSIGVTTAVPLPDGSKITLNTDSEIQVAVSRTERRINLRQGEAFFEVAKDPLRPFTVIAGDRRVVAVGTKFSVRREGKDIRVVVTEGKVLIDPAEGEAFLTAGSVAQTRHEKLTVQHRSLPQAEQFLSWRDGYLMFDEVTLAEAKLVIGHPGIADVPVTGHFRSTSVESFATLLERGFPVTVTREQDRIVLGLPRRQE
jgi:transmembrane sensor